MFRDVKSTGHTKQASKSALPFVTPVNAMENWDTLITGYFWVQLKEQYTFSLFFFLFLALPWTEWKISQFPFQIDHFHSPN